MLFHQFWRFPDFWRFKEGEGLQHLRKNFGLVGGLGLIVLAPRTLPVSEVVQHPLVSTHVIGPQTGSSNRAEPEPIPVERLRAAEIGLDAADPKDALCQILNGAAPRRRPGAR
ncbi:MAG: hypothetical protein ACRELF_26410, partial [Gemmataceae bacterium]